MALLSGGHQSCLEAGVEVRDMVSLESSLATTPSLPTYEVGSIQCFPLLHHLLLLSHGNPPPHCTLLGPLPQMPHPVQETESLAANEEARQEPPVLAEDPS